MYGEKRSKYNLWIIKNTNLAKNGCSCFCLFLLRSIFCLHCFYLRPLRICVRYSVSFSLQERERETECAYVYRLITLAKEIDINCVVASFALLLSCVTKWLRFSNQIPRKIHMGLLRVKNREEAQKGGPKRESVARCAVGKCAFFQYHRRLCWNVGVQVLKVIPSSTALLTKSKQFRVLFGVSLSLSLSAFRFLLYFGGTVIRQSLIGFVKTKHFCFFRFSLLFAGAGILPNFALLWIKII